jgi:ferrochelatase
MKRGFILMNTGSPDAPTEDAVRVYLRQFLMDPYVLDLPFPVRYAIVHWAILPKRPAESAEAYESVWTEYGSPLIHYCTLLAEQLRLRFEEPIELGMAYGNPSYKSAVEKLLDAGVEEICLLPMFPQYAMATVKACLAVVQKVLKGRAALRVIPPFFDDPTYIKPLAESLKGVEEHLLFSYHGLPERHLKKTDPTGNHCLTSPDCCEQPSPAHATCYRHQCMETTKAIVREAGIPRERYTVAFQSRLGRDKWLEPATDQMLEEMPARGIKNLAVMCPAFFCDCLETLEEIEIRGKEDFLKAGGESFRMIPCLNGSPAGVACLAKLMAECGSWPQA